MQQNTGITEPDNTAVRTALWRALHVQVDAEPHILEDEIGLKLIDPSDNWQERPDMKFTKRLRASIVARSRFIEDLIIEQSKQGICQYVILGSGLDTFAQRRPGIAANLQIYEIDQPDTLAWKEQRLNELGFGIPDYLHFVPVNFETSSWWKELSMTNFDFKKPAVVTCTGVSLYLTAEAINYTLSKIATLGPGSKLAMTFYLRMEFLDEEDKPMQERAKKGALKAGTPMISFFTPDEIRILAKEAGFTDVKTITTKDLEQRYFANRPDGLLPASGEIFLLATV
ncbi:class I SAM-dependent methyltransferase [Mucilaginibacter sp. OK098]|uniref:class I SAM-dependent methyltransferase n=1 Tax=Mucilaginibacter sp. OK098 TaxID=1855297 RepID=UPI0009143485|nr:class I SAM-dependent methyltransferase [Mucilaginibacter sp. OK098]SHM19715.1 methyltransferase, TIGR00027 family [Mucilaginibacter sp. OK098]